MLRSPSDRRSSLAPPEPLKGVDSAHKPLAVGVDVELGHLIEATDTDVNLLMQAVGFDFELLMEGDDFFAYDAVIGSPGPPRCGRSWSPRPAAAARRRTQG